MATALRARTSSKRTQSGSRNRALPRRGAQPIHPEPGMGYPGDRGPHTNFTVHFRVLLNGADYRYKFTDTSCPSFTFTGGTGKPEAVRGELWSDGIRAVGQALCPGIYRVAVSVMDRGRLRTYRHLPRPFGTATFTVR
jgi:hypothetical protein